MDRGGGHPLRTRGARADPRPQARGGDRPRRVPAQQGDPLKTDVLILGGGTGGVAAALAAVERGARVVMTEETAWLGGQLTSQIVPPDEHPWIERFGCTASYRRYRDLVRALYRDDLPLSPAARARRELNPGDGWVSRLCHEPRIGVLAIERMLGPALASGRLNILRRHKPLRAGVNDDRVESVELVDLASGDRRVVEPTILLDATELGDGLWITGTEYRLGSDAKSETGEPHAADAADPLDVQGLTWCFALADAGDAEDHRSDAPPNYDFWRAYRPPFWPGPHLGFEVLHAHTGETRQLPLYGRRPEDWYALFSYRQIVEPSNFVAGTCAYPATVVNWPQNDYFVKSILDVDPLPGAAIPDGFETAGAMGPNAAAALRESRELSLALLHWLRTEAPRHDDRGVGYPGLHVRPDLTDTPDGFAKYPYIREARRLRARRTVREGDVAAAAHPGRDRAPSFADSVGVGAYRIDLHPSVSGATTIDLATLPFEIPLGALIPERMRNILAAGKCLGVTHVTNGCYRLHPVEWNVGEAAGALAARAILARESAPDVAEGDLAGLQADLDARGIERAWPTLRAL